MIRPVRTSHRTALATTAALLLVLTGCWGVSGQGPDRRAHNPFEKALTAGTAADLEQAWDTTVSGALLNDPVVTGSGVFVNDNFTTYGLSARDGAVRWSHDVVLDGSSTFANQVVTHDDQVLARGYLYGFAIWGGDWLDPVTGQVEGQGGDYDTIRGDYAAHTTQQFNSGGAASGFELHNLADPSASWGDGAYVPFGSPDEQAASVTLGASQLFVVFRDDVRAYTLTEPPDIVPAPPDGYFRKQPTWTAGVAGGFGLVLSEDQSTAYVSAESGTVYALDTATGEVQWSLPVAATAQPALNGPTLFVPTADGDLVAVSAATGTVAWVGTGATAAPLRAQPAVAGSPGAGGVVFTGSDDGTVAAFPADGCGAATCSPPWTDDAGGAISGGPSVANGQVYVSTFDGHLVAYGLSP